MRGHRGCPGRGRGMETRCRMGISQTAGMRPGVGGGGEAGRPRDGGSRGGRRRAATAQTEVVLMVQRMHLVHHLLLPRRQQGGAAWRPSQGWREEQGRLGRTAARQASQPQRRQRRSAMPWGRSSRRRWGRSSRSRSRRRGRPPPYARASRGSPCGLRGVPLTISARPLARCGPARAPARPPAPAGPAVSAAGTAQ